MKKITWLSILTAFVLIGSITNCKRQKTSEAELRQIRERGAMIVDTTFRTLSGALMSAVKDSGVAYAVQYCNLNAYPLVEELSKEYDVTISRRTTMARNPQNKANAKDVIQNTAYAMQLRQGAELTPNLVEHATGFIYYHPIIVQPQCLVCHGSKDIIGPAYQTIASLYPEDEAFGYKAGDLRGMWRIDFGK
jgi:hypothetical protein